MKTVFDCTFNDNNWITKDVDILVGVSVGPKDFHVDPSLLYNVIEITSDYKSGRLSDVHDNRRMQENDRIAFRVPKIYCSCRNKMLALAIDEEFEKTGETHYVCPYCADEKVFYVDPLRVFYGLFSQKED